MIIIFYNDISIKIIKRSKYIFIDGTFSICPKSYYQILNILAKLKTNNLSIPILSTVMKTKQFKR